METTQSKCPPGIGKASSLNAYTGSLKSLEIWLLFSPETSAQVHSPPCLRKCQLSAPLLSPHVTSRHFLPVVSPSNSKSALSFCCFLIDRRNISICHGR